MHRIEPASATALACLALLAVCATPSHAADSRALDAILDGLNSVHPFSEVELSPDGKRLVYGNVFPASAAEPMSTCRLSG